MCRNFIIISILCHCLQWLNLKWSSVENDDLNYISTNSFLQYFIPISILAFFWNRWYFLFSSFDDLNKKRGRENWEGFAACSLTLTQQISWGVKLVLLSCHVGFYSVFNGKISLCCSNTIMCLLGMRHLLVTTKGGFISMSYNFKHGWAVKDKGDTYTESKISAYWQNQLMARERGKTPLFEC